MANHLRSKVKPGLCIPWEEKRKEILSIKGNEPLVKKIWEDIDSFGKLLLLKPSPCKISLTDASDNPSGTSKTSIFSA